MRLRRPVLLLLSLAAVCACAGESRSVDSRQVVLEAGIGQSKANISETGIFLWSKGDSFTAFLTDGSPVRFSLEGSGGRSMASFSATLRSGAVLANADRGCADLQSSCPEFRHGRRKPRSHGRYL